MDALRRPPTALPRWRHANGICIPKTPHKGYAHSHNDSNSPATAQRPALARAELESGARTSKKLQVATTNVSKSISDRCGYVLSDTFPPHETGMDVGGQSCATPCLSPRTPCSTVRLSSLFPLTSQELYVACFPAPCSHNRLPTSYIYVMTFFRGTYSCRATPGLCVRSWQRATRPGVNKRRHDTECGEGEGNACVPSTSRPLCGNGSSAKLIMGLTD